VAEKKEGRFAWKSNLLAASATVVILLVVFSLAVILVFGPMLGPVISAVFIGAAIGLAIGMLFGPFVPHALRRLRPPEKRKPIRTCHRVMGVVVVTLVTMTGLVGAAYIQEQYKLEKARRFYEVGVSFSAEGQDFEHTAIVEIRPTKIAFTTFSMTRQLRTIKLTSWMGKRLPSGAAVLFWVPWKGDLARLAQAQADAGERSVRFLPEAYWLDDADDPTVIESFVSPAYYEQSSPRIRIHWFSVKQVSNGLPTDPRREIGWLSKSNDAGRFEGLYANVVTKSEWHQITDVAAALLDHTKFSILPSEVQSELNRHFGFWEINVKRDHGIPLENSPISYRSVNIQANRRIRPVGKTSTGPRLYLDRPGLVLLYSGKGEKGTIDLRIEQHTVPFTVYENRWLYDPKSQLLLRFWFSSIAPGAHTFEKFYE